MENDWLIKLTDARLALRHGKPDQSASLSAPLLESVLRHLIFDNLDQMDSQLRARIRERQQEANDKPTGISFQFLESLYKPTVFTALQRITGRSTHVLQTLDLGACRRIRNRVSHGNSVTVAEARLLLSTAEHFLAYLGVDVESTWGGDVESVPLRFSNADECLHLLLRRIWEFPDAGGTRSSWAVKEGDTLRGELTRAIECPGIGTALFTTELASEVFGTRALPKIRACVDWGVSRTIPDSPYLLSEMVYDPITGQITNKLDFRHTIALASLMTRSGTHVDHQKHYLHMLLTMARPDGGWPAAFDAKESDLTAAVYGVEYLAISLRSATSLQENVEASLRQGQEWLILAAHHDGGWASGIFSSTSWDRLWSTAIILYRLLIASLPSFSEWSQALTDAASMLLHEIPAATYSSPLLQLRVETRVAAVLTLALQFDLISTLQKERVASWLSEWERRFLNMFRHIPARECDLATATFATRVLLRNKDCHKIGNQVLAGNE